MDKYYPIGISKILSSRLSLYVYTFTLKYDMIETREITEENMENKKREFKRFRDIGMAILTAGVVVLILSRFVGGIDSFVSEQKNMIIFLLYAGLALVVVGQCTISVLEGKIQDTVLKKGLIAGSIFFGIAAVLAFLAITGIAPVKQSVLLWICLGFGGIGLLLILNTLNMVSTFTLMLKETRKEAEEKTAIE